jgi:hypothetical protein
MNVPAAFARLTSSAEIQRSIAPHLIVASISLFVRRLSEIRETPVRGSELVSCDPPG